LADGRVIIDVELDDGRVVKGVTNIDRGFKGLMSTAKGVAASIGKIAAGIGVFELARKAVNMVTSSLDGAIDRYDTLNNFPRIMQQLGFDAATSDKAIKRLSDGIQGLPTRLDEIAKSAQSIALMTNDLDLAVETALALNNAFIASGSSAADAERGLTQYVQMLAKGKPDAQSWYTLLETMGPALNKVAEAFGFTGASAKNDLYEALKEGHITFDEFNAKIIELNNAQGGFAEMAQTAAGGIRTAITNMRTWFVMGVTDILKAIDEALGGTGSLEKAINGLKPIVQGFFQWIARNIPVVVDHFRRVKDSLDPWIPSVNQVRDIFISAFTAIKNFVVPALKDVVSFIMSIWGNLTAWWKRHGDMIIEAVQNIFAVMQKVWPVIKAIVVSTWESIKGTIQGAINVITGIIQFFAALFTGNWSGMWEAVKQIVSGAVTLIWNLIQLWFVGRILGVARTFVSSFRNVISNGLKGITNIFRNAFQGVLNFFKNIGRQFYNAGRGLIQQIINGIKSTARNVLGSARGLLQGVRNLLPFSPAKEGPLKDLDKLDFGGPIEKSIERSMARVKGAMAEMLQLPPRIVFQGEAHHYIPERHGVSGGTYNQYITINSPQPLSPSEIARKTRQSSQLLALEWGMR